MPPGLAVHVSTPLRDAQHERSQFNVSQYCQRVPMPYLDIAPDQRLYYETDNWSDAWREPESVLMIHGFTENTTAYRAWVPHLARNYRVIRFDQLGFGHSSAVADDFTFTNELLVDNAARMIERFGGGSAHVVGAKSGGLIAIELAAMRPALVKT